MDGNLMDRFQMDTGSRSGDHAYAESKSNGGHGDQSKANAASNGAAGGYREFSNGGHNDQSEEKQPSNGAADGYKESSGGGDNDQSKENQPSSGAADWYKESSIVGDNDQSKEDQSSNGDAHGYKESSGGGDNDQTKENQPSSGAADWYKESSNGSDNDQSKANQPPPNGDAHAYKESSSDNANDNDRSKANRPPNGTASKYAFVKEFPSTMLSRINPFVWQRPQQAESPEEVLRIPLCTRMDLKSGLDEGVATKPCYHPLKPGLGRLVYVTLHLCALLLAASWMRRKSITHIPRGPSSPEHERLAISCCAWITTIVSAVMLAVTVPVTLFTASHGRWCGWLLTLPSRLAPSEGLCVNAFFEILDCFAIMVITFLHMVMWIGLMPIDIVWGLMSLPVVLVYPLFALPTSLLGRGSGNRETEDKLLRMERDRRTTATSNGSAGR